MYIKRTTGFWVIQAMGIVFLLMFLIGQFPAIFNYDFSVSIGMQEGADKIGEMGVAVNRGIAAADSLIILPLLIFGLTGLWKRKSWGLFSMIGYMAYMAHWPMFCLFWYLFAKELPEFTFTNYILYTILLSFFTLYSIWALWYLYK
jgi:hypothetical protein